MCGFESEHDNGISLFLMAEMKNTLFQKRLG